MFTSRAEYRILLRQDNADLRLTETGHKLGLASDDRFERVNRKKTAVESLIRYLKTESISPDLINELLEKEDTATVQQKVKMASILLRPQISLKGMITHIPDLKRLVEKEFGSDVEILEETEILVKYEGYIEKETEIVEKLSKFEDLVLRPDFDYKAIHALSWEAREKLTSAKPGTIGQASRISGVSPADISVLLVYIGR